MKLDWRFSEKDLFVFPTMSLACMAIADEEKTFRIIKSLIRGLKWMAANLEKGEEFYWDASTLGKEITASAFAYYFSDKTSKAIVKIVSVDPYMVQVGENLYKGVTRNRYRMNYDPSELDELAHDIWNHYFTTL